MIETIENALRKARNAGVTLGVVAISGLAGLCFSRGINLVNAWNGKTPLSYVWAENDPTTFLKVDFLKELNVHLGNSLAMRIYPLAYSRLGIEPETTQYVFILATALLCATSLWLLTSTLVPHVAPPVLWLVVGLALLTETANGDLARFGQANLSLGQAYSVAIPLQVIALALGLRRRTLSAGAVLGLLACVHLTLGAITTIIVASMLSGKPRVWLDWRLWIGGTIVGVCAMAWILGVVDPNADSYMRMETAHWVQWVRFSNSHWFPFDLGVLTLEHSSRLTPLLALALLAWNYPASEITAPNIRRGWIIGLIASMFITIIGLIISLFPVSQPLVMIAMHRASGATLLLLLPMAVLCLARFMEKGNLITSAIAVMAIACPFFGTSGVPLFPTLALVGFALCGRMGEELSRRQRGIVVSLAVTATGYALFLVNAGHAHLWDMAFVGLLDAWLITCVFFTVKIVLAIITRCKPYPDFVGRTISMILIVVLIWHGMVRNWREHPRVPQTEAKAYLDAQTWARLNTPQHALFMTDPAHTYGWKDYSRRASYGNIRDWTHSVIVYRADGSKFTEGVRRARRLGVDPETYLARAVATSEISPGSVEHQKMYQDIRSAYYLMPGQDLITLARDEGIDYFVFQLKYAHLLQLKPVYQNAHFAICEPVQQKYRLIAEQPFPITLPLDTVNGQELLAPRYDWINRGSRGTTWVNKTGSKIATLRLSAGTPNHKREHILLLSPKAKREEGFPVFLGAQGVAFACDLRLVGKNNLTGNIQLRLDVLSSKDGWSYHSRTINITDNWSHFDVFALLASNTVSVYPTLIWEPTYDGSMLEFRSPTLRWFAYEPH
jgi:hypothetical protein